MNAINNTINNALRNARMKRGWSIERASERACVSRTTYIRWEQGTQSPHGCNLGLLCQAFQMSAEELGFHPEEIDIHDHQLNQGYHDDKGIPAKRLGMDELCYFVYAFQRHCEDTANAALWFNIYRHCPNLFQAAAAHMQGEWSEITFTRDVHTVPGLIGEQQYNHRQQHHQQHGQQHHQTQMEGRI